VLQMTLLDLKKIFDFYQMFINNINCFLIFFLLHSLNNFKLCDDVDSIYCIQLEIKNTIDTATSKLPLGIPVWVALSASTLYQANHDMNQSFRILVSSERSILHTGADGMLLNIKESSLWEYWNHLFCHKV
jgi:hypothetical protein